LSLATQVAPFDRERIARTFDTICRRTLAFPHGARVPQFSRINADGAPFQFAVNVGTAPSLEFMSETAWPGASGSQRLRASRACIAAIAKLFDAEEELEEIEALIDELAPATAPALLTDPAGALWIGAAFMPMGGAALRTYVNGAWGDEAGRWQRLRRVAAHFGADDAWREAERLLPPAMKPLGAALAIAKDCAPTGRIYVSGYGHRFERYEALARAVSGERFAAMLHGYGERLLGADLAFPTPTAVCSFGLSAGRPLDFKLELCCHCLFASDLQASTRLRACFDLAGADAANYLRVLDALSRGNLDGDRLCLHSYAGIGCKQGAEYFSVYLQPDLRSQR
jgi:hypothetical protein